MKHTVNENDSLIRLNDYFPIVKKTLFNEPCGLTTGLKKLDDKTRGLKPTELIVIGARSSMGKTSLCLDMVLANPDKRIAIFSLETSIKLLIERMLCNLAKINYNKMKKDNLLDNEKQRLVVSEDELLGRNILINTDTKLSSTDLNNIINKNNSQIDLIVVDYLQLMQSSKRTESRYQEVGSTARELKAVAKEFNVPIVVAAQLNRQADYREATNFKPRLSDLRESGDIENTADIVLLLYRPSYYDLLNNPNATDNGQAEVIVAKNRNGSTGIVKCLWDREAMSFSDPININLEEF